MTSKEKTRYEELEAKDCLVDEDEIIEYFELKCEMLEKENQELLIALENKNNEIKFLKTLINDNKLKKAIGIIKRKYVDVYLIESYRFATYNFIRGVKGKYEAEKIEDLTQEEYELLKEVLENENKNV